ncbi:MAG: 16S rRNA (cytidine(1402)-2'-O)-methyltransferase [Candidatus Cloacimonetes bacterium]|nr:16S rRNA (cytidine(1402)-2'-O)-methyltransferase [Candidatus Cloacimonadota bacterium]
MNAGLYVVAVPIGNKEDITLRALDTLKNADFVIMEERKSGCALLRSYGITKEFVLLNEHNEKEDTRPLLRRLIEEQSAVVLISDAGTPLFADPGNRLVKLCHDNKFPVVCVPGASSLTATLQVSGLPLNKFLYQGFLSANKEARCQELRNLPENIDIVIMEAPYRLKSLIRDMVLILGKNRHAIIAYNLTTSTERLFRGTLIELQTIAQKLAKAPFVIILRKSVK